MGAGFLNPIGFGTTLEPALPLVADHGDLVGEVLRTPDRTLLHLEHPHGTGLSDGVLGGGAGHCCPGGDLGEGLQTSAR